MATLVARDTNEHVAGEYKGVAIPKKQSAMPTNASNENGMQVAKKSKIAISEMKKFSGHLEKATDECARRLVVNDDTPHEAWNELKKKHEVSKKKRFF